MAGADSQVPYPQPPNYVTPYGCYDTTQGADGPQVGASNIATITTSTAAQPPYSTHITVVVSQGYWLMQVRGGWINPDHTFGGFVWDNPDGINNTTYETDGYGAGFGVVAVACPWLCLSSPPSSTTTSTLPEPYCAAPPTTHLSTPSSSTTTSSMVVTTTEAPDMSPTPAPQARVQAVVATPQFTG